MSALMVCPECHGPVTVRGRIAVGYLTCRRNGHVVRVADVVLVRMVAGEQA